jgi:thiamine biosynthesis protein ThiS
MGGITLEINGESRTIPVVANVEELIRHLGIASTRIAVEVNRKIIRRGEWTETPISDHDRVEIVQFVGGG